MSDFLSITPNHLIFTPSRTESPIFDCTLTLFSLFPNTPLPASVPGSACGVKYFSPSRKSLTPPTLPGRLQPSESIWRCRLPAALLHESTLQSLQGNGYSGQPPPFVLFPGSGTFWSASLFRPLKENPAMSFLLHFP